MIDAITLQQRIGMFFLTFNERIKQVRNDEFSKKFILNPYIEVF